MSYSNGFHVYDAIARNAVNLVKLANPNIAKAIVSMLKPVGGGRAKVGIVCGIANANPAAFQSQRQSNAPICLLDWHTEPLGD
jgi:hypothetical protein